jgi:isopenicillin-N N-acyltransferase-like protein
MFKATANLSWEGVQALAMQFEPVIRTKWPEYLAEIRGIADGTDLGVEDIIAINVRTEIAFGLFSDGCTALSWKEKGNGGSWLAQNWDWNPLQKRNLVQLSIEQEGKPRIHMITEAGLIGKIGFNERGVGVCLNAIRAKGLDMERLPCHLGLRMVLESSSRVAAVRAWEGFGVASSGHMLVADSTGGMGLEWSSKGVEKVEMNERGQVFHANHYLKEHEGVVDLDWLKDSRVRVRRIEELCEGKEVVGFEELGEVFRDVQGFPGSICRKQEGEVQSETLFNIVMDLKGLRAEVVVGRPVEPEEKLELVF